MILKNLHRTEHFDHLLHLIWAASFKNFLIYKKMKLIFAYACKKLSNTIKQLMSWEQGLELPHVFPQLEMIRSNAL